MCPCLTFSRGLQRPPSCIEGPGSPVRCNRGETVAGLHLVAANFVPMLLGDGLLQVFVFTGFAVLVSC